VALTDESGELPRADRRAARAADRARARGPRDARRHDRAPLAGPPAAVPARADLRPRRPDARAVDDVQLARAARRPRRAARRGDAEGRLHRAVSVHRCHRRPRAGRGAVPAGPLLGPDRARAPRPLPLLAQARQRGGRRPARRLQGLPRRRRRHRLRPPVQERRRGRGRHVGRIPGGTFSRRSARSPSSPSTPSR
jgi:hypothetical protein